MHRLRPGIAEKVQKVLSYDRGMIASAGCIGIGLAFVGTLAWRYVRMGLRLESLSHPAIFGLLLIILGFQTFCFTLLLEMAQRVARSGNP
jgi:hypothetical protein